MRGRKPRPRMDMTLKEIRELLLLKEWTRDELARNLKPPIGRNSVDRWFVAPEEQRRHPSPEHVKQMREWLREARDEARKQTA